jgi:phosphoserine phosphatase
MPTTPRDDGRLADLERLLDVARQLGATVELDPLLVAIAAAATSVLDCERATVFLLDRKAGELSSRLATGIAGAPIEEIRFPVTLGIAGEVARSGAAINIPDAYADPRFYPEFDRRSGYRTRSMLTIPLIAHDGATVGVLQLLNKLGGPFAARDEEIAGFLGTQAGVAIHRQLLLEQFAVKQRLERDLNIARDIQRGLLPRDPPVVPGFDIAGWNRPADETGGDYFDFMPVDGGGLAITIADATGHGIGPALVVSETRALFRAIEGDPRDLSAARKDIGVFLMAARDATVKFSDLYAQTRSAQARADFEQLLSDLETHFRNRTDALLSNDHIDLDVEIDVLRDRLQLERTRSFGPDLAPTPPVPTHGD